MRLQNARNLGGGDLICGRSGVGGDAVYIYRGGSTVKVLAGGESLGAVARGKTVVLAGGRVTIQGGKLSYESE